MAPGLLFVPFLAKRFKKEYCHLVYKWALDLLPFLLEKSAVSLEIADVLRGCTFTTMALGFPQRMWVAKDAMRRYILRVESVMGIIEL